MDLQITQASIELHPNEPLRLHAGAGNHVTGIRGTTWLTIDGDPRDIILAPGDTHAFEQAGSAMVQALGGDALLNAEDGVEVRTPARSRTASRT